MKNSKKHFTQYNLTMNLMVNSLKIFSLALMILLVSTPAQAASDKNKGCIIKAKEYGPKGANQQQRMSTLQPDGSYLPYSRQECINAGEKYFDAIVPWNSRKLNVFKNTVTVKTWNTQYNIVKTIYNGEVINQEERDEVDHTDENQYDYIVKNGFKCWLSQNCFIE